MQDLLARIKTEKLTGANLPEILTAIVEKMAEQEKLHRSIYANMLYNKRMLEHLQPLADWAVRYLLSEAEGKLQFDKEFEESWDANVKTKGKPRPTVLTHPNDS